MVRNSKHQRLASQKTPGSMSRILKNFLFSLLCSPLLKINCHNFSFYSVNTGNNLDEKTSKKDVGVKKVYTKRQGVKEKRKTKAVNLYHSLILYYLFLLNSSDLHSLDCKLMYQLLRFRT